MEEVGKKVIQGFYRGEEWASRLVFQTYRRLVYFAIRSVLPGKEDAEDAYLETFARLFKNKPEFGPSNEGLSSYLVKSAKTIAIDFAKKNHRMAYVDLEDKAAATESGTVSAVIDGYLCPPLGQTEAEVVAYRAVFSLSFREVAAIVGHPETTVRRIYRKAMRRLKETWSK